MKDEKQSGSWDQVRNRSSNGGQPSVDVHIEELVLKGFGAGHRSEMGEVLKQELTRQLSEQSTFLQTAENVVIGDLSVGTLNLSTNPDETSMGAQLARVIYGGLKR